MGGGEGGGGGMGIRVLVGWEGLGGVLGLFDDCVMVWGLRENSAG